MRMPMRHALGMRTAELLLLLLLMMMISRRLLPPSYRVPPHQLRANPAKGKEVPSRPNEARPGPQLLSIHYRSTDAACRPHTPRPSAAARLQLR